MASGKRFPRSFCNEKFQLFTYLFILSPSKWPKVSLPATASVFVFSFQSLSHNFLFPTQLPSLLDCFSRVKVPKVSLPAFFFFFFFLPSLNLKTLATTQVVAVKKLLEL